MNEKGQHQASVLLYFPPPIYRVIQFVYGCLSLSKLHQVPLNHVGNGLQQYQSILESSFLSGIKQRLLSFIFRGTWTEETDQTQVG
ncbi:hypothetical protein Acr_20g0009450 [Actinidia rufa]|uniref:Uncharacterized protein n=1 Tax=Actinidia rufa TaxID=165716 RepID=A0A7J0GEA2_9ERIC|nr:hypothetical protein Acr_20g0009450 [Actinidia rufa]